jgi:hypothetical protein
MAFGLSDKVIQQLAADHRKLQGIHAGASGQGITGAAAPTNRRRVELLETLYAASDHRDAPERAQARILVKGSDGKLIPLVVNGVEVEITIVNWFENISVDSGTYAKAEVMDGEWELYAADCPGESSGS